MFEITVHNHGTFNKDTNIQYNRIILIFDSIDQFHSFQEKSPSLVKSLAFSDESQLQSFLALDKKLNVSSDTVSIVESFFFTGENRNLTKIIVMVLPTACSRHNSPSRCHALTSAIKGHKGGQNDHTMVILNSIKESHILGQVLAIGRSFPVFTLKSGDNASSVHVMTKIDILIEFPSEHSLHLNYIIKSAQVLIENIRLTQRLVDTPPNILHSDSYIESCHNVINALGGSNNHCYINVIQGKQLQEQGFGGIWNVGKAAEHLPALVVLSYVPPASSSVTDVPSICLVGKGIIYDTGGLSIKTPTTVMAGMKIDMAGSAAVLGAFASAVSVGNLKQPLHGLLCIAENSVSSASMRPDDIYIALSGKSVEVNNTDAEGRLVLSDGVFYAYKHLNANYIIDIATLTGAQGIATGKNHAAIYCNTDEFEHLAVDCGKYTGDLTHPLPYCPEFYRKEFHSQVADMKNSVADRSNAQSSCAGQFIGNHIEDFLTKGGNWLHVDMASPACSGERATGYGVALMYELVHRLNERK